jgi:subtilisin family serine protease
VLAASLVLALRAYAEEEACGPFEPASAPFQVANAEPGMAPAQPSGGTITTLPEAAASAPAPPRGEALLALPKDASGALPADVELAPGARIAASYWSPILCATVARVVGPEDLDPEALVPRRPPGAAVVANQVYATAQAESVAKLPTPGGRDPYRPLQYGLDQLGIDASRAVSNGAGVRVALLDSAPASGHADLGTLEILALEGGPSAQPGAHGTLVAGVVAAMERNEFGIAGVAPGVSLVAVPVCTPQGASASDRCLLYDLLRGIDRAWEREAQVMNLSLVGPDNPLLARSMTRLDELGVLVVAAAGNEGTSEPRYPAAYPSVIGVGASDRERRVHARSNRGLSAELYAPGVEVLSTVPGDSFAFGTGTSFAASHVSGTLALLLGAGATPAEARAALFRQASAASEGSDVVLMPPLCDVLARLGKPCAQP